MVDPLIIKHADIKLANADYESLFLKHGNILFELNTEENRELVHAVSQFEKYTDKESDIGQRAWIKKNINPLPSLKPLAVFIFLRRFRTLKSLNRAITSPTKNVTALLPFITALVVKKPPELTFMLTLVNERNSFLSY